MDKLSCSFTGHRPSRFSFGFDEENEKCVRLKQVLTGQIGLLIQSGVVVFHTGMALGVDQWAASIVLDMKREHPGVKLIAALPCETQADKWSVEQRERYFNTLAECDEVVTLNTRYTRTCMFERNRWLIDHAEYLLAVYDGGERGGTAYTVRYAEQNHRQIILINPDTLEVTSAVDYEALKRRAQLKLVTGKEE